ncbi:MAG TPA: recombination protein RecR [Spirochaetaceae bacterium]|nr:recombination protein RecR [Spirochaetaceae bacterium]
MDLIESLSYEISKLPGVGSKSARRIVTHLLKAKDDYVSNLVKLMSDLKSKVGKCPVCGMFTENEVCSICSSSLRKKDRICVVEESEDVHSFEESKVFDGLYHVLWGRISPYNGIYPEMLNIESLKKRSLAGGIKEIIIATNPDDEGDVTASYVKNAIGEICPDIIFSRLSSGLQSGADISFASSRALYSAFENRVKL